MLATTFAPWSDGFVELIKDTAELVIERRRSPDLRKWLSQRYRQVRRADLELTP